MRQHAEILKQTCLDLVYVVGRVLVGHVGWADVQLEVWAVVLKVVIVRQFCHNSTSLHYVTITHSLLITSTIRLDQHHHL